MTTPPACCVCPPGAYQPGQDPDDALNACVDAGCGACIHGCPDPDNCTDRWLAAIPELAAVLDPNRPVPTAAQIDQARAELDYARAHPAGGEG